VTPLGEDQSIGASTKSADSCSGRSRSSREVSSARDIATSLSEARPRSHFDLLRKNRGKEWASPLQILAQRVPQLCGAPARKFSVVLVLNEPINKAMKIVKNERGWLLEPQTSDEEASLESLIEGLKRPPERIGDDSPTTDLPLASLGHCTDDADQSRKACRSHRGRASGRNRLG
jgi:hypothetical protein